MVFNSDWSFGLCHTNRAVNYWGKRKMLLYTYRSVNITSIKMSVIVFAIVVWYFNVNIPILSYIKYECNILNCSSTCKQAARFHIVLAVSKMLA